LLRAFRHGKFGGTDNTLCLAVHNNDVAGHKKTSLPPLLPVINPIFAEFERKNRGSADIFFLSYESCCIKCAFCTEVFMQAVKVNPDSIRKNFRPMLRRYAVFCFVACLGLLLINIINLKQRGINLLLLSSLAVNVGTVVMGFALIFRPEIWQLFTIIHVAQSIKLGFFDGDMLSPLIYLTGWAIAFHSGFFERNPKRKFVAVIAFSLLIIASWLRLGLLPFFRTCLALSASTVIAIFLYSLFRNSIEELLPSNLQQTFNAVTKPIIRLQDYGLSERELTCVYAVLKGYPYAWLADYLIVSPSVIKKMMPRLYTKFGVYNETAFLSLMSNYAVEYPPSFDVPQTSLAK
jgi:DNA-binding CsgD family transcriptional regulator